MRLIWPWQDRARRFSWLKASALALILAPGIRFTYHVAIGDYGIFPIALGGMVYWSGVWATVVLLIALAVTPALTIFRWPALIDARRMIGVMALVYTVAHIVVYFAMRSRVGEPARLELQRQDSIESRAQAAAFGAVTSERPVRRLLTTT